MSALGSAPTPEGSTSLSKATAKALGAVAREKLELLMIVANKPGSASHEQADVWENELLAAIEGLEALARCEGEREEADVHRKEAAVWEELAEKREALLHGAKAVPTAVATPKEGGSRA